MTKPVWSHVLALSAWTLKIAHIINYQEAQTMPDCIRYIIGVFCKKLKITGEHSCFILAY